LPKSTRAVYAWILNPNSGSAHGMLLKEISYKFCLPGIVILWLLPLFSQSTDSIYNLIPNPGFELIDELPKTWYNLGGDFTRASKFWSSPTGGSPDLYSPSLTVPHGWASKGFGNTKPKSGKNMVGLTLFGCQGGKPHCREYIQVRLIEPLVMGQKYELDFWLKHLPGSLEINNIGAYFSKKEYKIQTDPLLYFKPQVLSQYIISCEEYWERFSATFIATNESEFMIIGNFYPDSLTVTRSNQEDGYGFAYYYIDDISLKKVRPLVPMTLKTDDLRLAAFSEGDIIELKYLYFESDKSELHPRSFIELNKLVRVMQARPSMKIEIRGHTDNLGEEQYNLKLSKDRAQAVARYLIKNKIPSKRLKFDGYGSRLPIDSNESEEGRQNNRRVEIYIEKL
jgi:OmpA-OmpF porin, OOP family